ncbi:MAG: type II CRISPR-associated endonuclease Cas1 [Lachnospiraceae bacterium]|nr:type II CRISPR-associated endonuclease Cas1 [Lachnospiraceae bacterium]
MDNLKITLTSRMLSLLAVHNVGVIFCNHEHLPIGFYCSYDNHSHISKTIHYQINAGTEYYNQLWQLIVQAKIINQYKVLEILGKNADTVVQLKNFCKNVTEGDITNREAHAAKVYFNELMGCSFSRGNDELLLNSGLNYGYAIFRSYLAKLCVGYGLNSQLGIHHKNEYNRFNLADDLIEPFRPLVDYYAYLLLKNEEYFKIEHRHKLVNLLNHKILYNKKKMFLCNAMEEYVSNIASCIIKKQLQTEFPDIQQYLGEPDEI